MAEEHQDQLGCLLLALFVLFIIFHVQFNVKQYCVCCICFFCIAPRCKKHVKVSSKGVAKRLSVDDSNDDIEMVQFPQSSSKLPLISNMSIEDTAGNIKRSVSFESLEIRVESF